MPIALIAVARAALPPVLVLIAGGYRHHDWLVWAAVPVGMVTGLALTGLLGRRAAARLTVRRVTVLRILATTV